jgi:two-component system sensor histidine kinase UhpB
MTGLLLSTAQRFLEHSSSMVRRGKWLAARGLWLYSFAILGWLAGHWRESELVGDVCNWAPVPADLVVLAVIFILQRGAVTRGVRRWAWWLVFLSVALDLMASLAWTAIGPSSRPLYGALAEGLYLLYYPLMTAAFALFFISCGGSFRRPRLWLDALTVMLSVLALVWTTLYEAPLAGGATEVGIVMKLSYALAISVTTTMAVLLFTQIVDWRSEKSMMQLIGAALVGFVADSAWLAVDAGGSAALGPIYTASDLVFNIGDVVFCALVAGAAAAEQSRPLVPPDARHRIGNPYSFWPELVLLLAISLLIGSEATQRGFDVRILVALVLLGAALVVARQRGVRYELDRLNRHLAAREAEAHLTELVRSSADLIAVVNAQRVLTFVSPAAQAMLGVPVEDLQNTPAPMLLGEQCEAAVGEFIDSLISCPTAPTEMEARIRTPTGMTRAVHITGRNEFASARIRGIVLTIRDVTAERELEREVLEIAARERLRLSSDIHEGLGQELTGISLLLKSASMRDVSDPCALRYSLENITGHVNRAIATARDVASGLSPLQVVRGSLASALHRLAQDVSSRVPVHVEFGSAIDEERLDDGAAEHFYRIAQESISNALRHSGCTTVKVALRSAAAEVTLTITDNGRGFDRVLTGRGGIGLRMMEYRARIAGGALRVERSPGGGTRVVAWAPLKH